MNNVVHPDTSLLPGEEFNDAEVVSSYGYLSGYKQKSITEQMNRLRELFPGLGYADEKLADGTLPLGAEGWFAIPNIWGNRAVMASFGGSYGIALRTVLNLIKETRGSKFQNYLDGQLGPERLRQTAKTAGVLEMLSDEQKNHDILVVAAQFGLRHRGRSVRRAREVFTSGEFGLGAFAIGIMILTHPERLMNYDDLWIDCSGDEYDDPGSGVRFDGALYFSFGTGDVRFGASWFGSAFGGYGSASGFVPQN